LSPFNAVIRKPIWRELIFNKQTHSSVCIDRERTRYATLDTYHREHDSHFLVITKYSHRSIALWHHLRLIDIPPGNVAKYGKCTTSHISSVMKNLALRLPVWVYF